MLILFVQVSQPPLLSMMIRAVYGKTHDQALLKRAMPILLKEYAFWTSSEALISTRIRNMIIVNGSCIPVPIPLV